MLSRIKLLQGDITLLEVDVIVNAANNSLLGGGGVDGAIHRAAGAELLESCARLNGCETGKAKITNGFNLHAKKIIHTVGPIWKGGNSNEKDLLQNCYLESIKLASLNACDTIAFPNISTGIYGFPKLFAAEIAVSNVNIYLKSNPIPTKVIFICFDEENFQIYKSIIDQFRI